MSTSKKTFPSEGRSITQKQQDQHLREKIDPLSMRVSTGVTGLDEILYGGLIPKRTYLVRGGPGCGKTTLGLHFLTEGTAKGETGLLITLGEQRSVA